LIAPNGDDVLPGNNGLSGWLPERWRPGADLYMVGLPDGDFKKIRFQTTSGQTGEILL